MSKTDDRRLVELEPIAPTAGHKSVLGLGGLVRLEGANDIYRITSIHPHGDSGDLAWLVTELEKLIEFWRLRAPLAGKLQCADALAAIVEKAHTAAAPLPGEAGKLLGDEQLERLGFLVCETDGDCDFCHTLGVPQADYFWYRTSHEYVEGDYYCRSCATKKVAAWEAEAKTYENWQPSPKAGEPVGRKENE